VVDVNVTGSATDFIITTGRTASRRAGMPATNFGIDADCIIDWLTILAIFRFRAASVAVFSEILPFA
jgi:hypothetical protein